MCGAAETLRVLYVLQQAPSGPHGLRCVHGVESGQIAGPELPAKRSLSGFRVEMPRRPFPEAVEIAQPVGLERILGEQYLSGPQPFQFAPQRVAVGKFGNGEPAAGHVEPGQSDGAVTAQVDRRQVRGPFRIQQGVFGERSRGDDAHDFPGYRALARPGIANLLADGHGFTQAHESAKVVVHRAHGYTRHGYGLAAGLPAAGQCDVHQFGAPAGVVVEEFVEIAHPVEQQHIRMLGLDTQVLLHHGGVRFVQNRGAFGGTRTL